MASEQVNVDGLELPALSHDTAMGTATHEIGTCRMPVQKTFYCPVVFGAPLRFVVFGSKWLSASIPATQIAALSMKLCRMVEGSLEVKLPTIWTDEKQRWEESEKRREEERERVRRKKIQVREKVGKSRNTVFFQ